MITQQLHPVNTTRVQEKATMLIPASFIDATSNPIRTTHIDRIKKNLLSIMVLAAIPKNTQVRRRPYTARKMQATDQLAVKQTEHYRLQTLQLTPRR